MMNTEPEIKRIWIRQGQKPTNGTKAKRGESGTANKPKRTLKTESRLIKNAKIVGHSLKILALVLTYFVLETAIGLTTLKPNLGERLKEIVRFAALNSILALLTKEKPVVVSALESQETPKDGVEVFNITLKNHNVYYANDVLVENCADVVMMAFDRQTFFSPLIETQSLNIRPLPTYRR